MSACPCEMSAEQSMEKIKENSMKTKSLSCPTTGSHGNNMATKET